MQFNAKIGSDQESAIWLRFLQKNLNVSLLNEQSPATSPKLFNVQDNNSDGTKAFKFVFYLEDQSEEKQEILSISNRCVLVPEKIRPLIPHLTESYLAAMLNKLSVHQGCIGSLTSVTCEKGYSVASELRIVSQKGKVHYLPTLYSTQSSRVDLQESPVAGMVCIYQTPQNYLRVQMISGTLKQYHDGIDPMRWSLKTIVLPPLNNGNNQYLNP